MGVSEFYRDKVVFVTGGSGFMGKVLLEKLLRSCPDVQKLYILLRPKGGKTVAERREVLLRTRIFDNLKKTNPSQLEKLVVIPGDLMQPGLGLSSSDHSRLEKEVNIIFHTAATVKFDEALEVSLNMNVRGTNSLLLLAKKMPLLEVLVHVSTAYSNCDREVVEEVVYPFPTDPAKVLATADWLKPDLLDDITPRILSKHPNTYTFTKALAESLVNRVKEELPVVIVRPSIVCCAWKEPLPGWVDNFNGPTGLMTGIGKGFTRTILARSDLVADLVPVDVPVNLVICAAWHRAKQRPLSIDELPVYNCVSGPFRPILWGEFESWWLQELERNPMKEVLRNPVSCFTASPVANQFWTVFSHFLPAIVYDGCLLMSGSRSRMVRMQQKVRKTVHCLSYFTTHQWTFTSDNLVKLRQCLSCPDQQEFNFSMTDMDWQEYVAVYRQGIDKYLLKEQSQGSPTSARAFKVVRRVVLLLFLLSWPLLAKRSRIMALLLAVVKSFISRVAVCSMRLLMR